MTPATLLRSPIRAAAAGAAVGALLGAAAPVAAWRPVLVGAAAGLVPVVASRLVLLARAEWQRRPAPLRDYLLVALPLTAALLLVAVATS